MTTREEQFSILFPKAQSFRLKQLKQALFDTRTEGWKDVSNLPKEMITVLEKEIPWMSIGAFHLHESKRHDTYKAIVKTLDDKLFETVLMANARGSWTICVSSQIGCAMRCTFCATGTMGLKRSLTSDEIIDQYRYWRTFLQRQPALPQRIANVVFMGMGEPLANYDNVKKAIFSKRSRPH